MSQRADPSPAPVADRVRLVGVAMAVSVGLFAIVALVFAGTVETELPGAAVWAIAGAGLLLLGVGSALDGPEPGRKIAALAARETGGLLGAVLTFLTGYWIFAAALGALAIAAIAVALPPGGGAAARG